MIIRGLFRSALSPIFLPITSAPEAAPGPSLVLDFVSQTYVVEG